MRIMLVDDEPASTEYIAAILARYAPEYEVCFIAGDGEEAFCGIKATGPDVVITDVAMPRMNGLKLAEKIRNDYPNTKTIIISGYQEFEYARSALRFGVTDYLLKPVSAKELLSCLRGIDDALRSTDSAPQSPAGGDALFNSLEGYVISHLGDSITLSSLCRHCGVSQTTANRVFRKSAGMSFLEYLTKKRISKACELIRSDPGIMIKQVAVECGFCDPLYFSKVFKVYMGCAPSEYAQRAGDDM